MYVKYPRLAVKIKSHLLEEAEEICQVNLTRRKVHTASVPRENAHH